MSSLLNATSLPRASLAPASHRSLRLGQANRGSRLHYRYEYGSLGFPTVALHAQHHVQGLSRAKLVTAPVKLSSLPCIQGIEEELLHGHWIKLLIRRAGDEQSWQPPWKQMN